VLGEEVGWWWYHGVVVVEEKMCRGVYLVDIEKRYMRNLLVQYRFQVQWVPFLIVVAFITILSAVQVIHLAREHPYKSC
jgi:hypothetical protein